MNSQSYLTLAESRFEQFIKCQNRSEERAANENKEDTADILEAQLE